MSGFHVVNDYVIAGSSQVISHTVSSIIDPFANVGTLKNSSTILIVLSSRYRWPGEVTCFLWGTLDFEVESPVGNGSIGGKLDQN